MSLQYKDDWGETKQRFRAWWAGEVVGRCAIAVTAPKNGPSVIEKPETPPTPERRWMDLDYISALSRWKLSRTFYGGEAFPVWDYGYPGLKTLATFLGCPIQLDFRTGWVEPILIGDSLDCSSLTIDESNPYWRFTLEWLSRGAKEAPGKSILSVGAFGGSGDALARIRGTNRLLYDVVDRPDQVAAADRTLMELWCKVYDRFYEIVKDAADGGSTCWFSLWAPGKFYAVQNDFSYNISPRMFRKIFLPVIEKQVAFLDYSLYHVDGVNSFIHVDALCELDELDALQILPGAGKPSPLHYMDVLKKVQSRGKNLHITIPACEVKTALKELSARGLFINTHCESEDDARRLLKNAERWSKDRSAI